LLGGWGSFFHIAAPVFFPQILRALSGSSTHSVSSVCWRVREIVMQRSEVCKMFERGNVISEHFFAQQNGSLDIWLNLNSPNAERICHLDCSQVA
jgi:hypothetical protein